METGIYQKIQLLCKRNGISIAKLESDLGFSSSSIKKWCNSSPTADKIKKVAIYFEVSTDYLLGISEIESPISELFIDEDIISFQRAREKMTPQDRERMMNMLKVGFDYAFQD